MNTDVVSKLLLRIADDELIIAHRHSEWTGLGPILEEDVAFSSIAQDKLGHAQALYALNHELCGGPAPDQAAFHRSPEEFLCCQFVELPNGEYDFSLMRHFLFDAAEFLRFEHLRNSSLEPLAKLAVKIHSELKYHLYHGKTWVTQLSGNGTAESKARMQEALNYAWPYALGMFEGGDHDVPIKSSKLSVPESELQKLWLDFVVPVLTEAGLTIPADAKPVYGGRQGKHSEYLAPLLNEMTEVVRIDPEAEW